jgi:SAM-dependent methyltransferase
MNRIDWGQGRYELTADRLAPAADVAVAALAPQPGRADRRRRVRHRQRRAADRARRGHRHGRGPAERLLGVARERAAAEGADAAFVPGEGTALPFADGELDAAISVFGVIFAEARAAALELRRVVRPGGRIVLTAWTTTGPLAEVGRTLQGIMGIPPTPATWSDPDVLRELFAGHRVSIAEERIAFDAPSVEAYVAEHAEHHPMWLAGTPVLREIGREDEARERVTAIFADANEAPGAFRTTSSYYVVTVGVLP